MIDNKDHFLKKLMILIKDSTFNEFNNGIIQ